MVLAWGESSTFVRNVHQGDCCRRKEPDDWTVKRRLKHWIWGMTLPKTLGIMQCQFSADFRRAQGSLGLHFRSGLSHCAESDI